MQPIYGYHMMEKTPYHWALTVLTDQRYRPLRHATRSQWLSNYRNKVEVLVRVGRALVGLH